MLPFELPSFLSKMSHGLVSSIFVDLIGCITNVLILFLSAGNTNCWGIGASCLLPLIGEKSMIMPSPIIRVDLQEKQNELRDMIARLLRDQVIWSLRNHLVERHTKMQPPAHLPRLILPKKKKKIKIQSKPTQENKYLDQIPTKLYKEDKQIF